MGGLPFPFNMMPPQGMGGFETNENQRNNTLGIGASGGTVGYANEPSRRQRDMEAQVRSANSNISFIPRYQQKPSMLTLSLVILILGHYYEQQNPTFTPPTTAQPPFRRRAAP